MTTEQAGVQPAITSYWNLRGASYDGQPHHSITDGPERDAWLAALLPLLPAAPADVLDIGCGTGFLSILLAGCGYRVTGVDPAEGMLAEARRKAAGLAPAPTFCTGDGHAPPVSGESFDAVVNRHVLWTLHDPPAAFAAWLRALRPGGVLLAVDSLWFADGRRSGSSLSPALREAWERLYDGAMQERLPLMRAESLEPVVDLLTAAGFADARITRLDAVEAYDAAIAAVQGEADAAQMPRYALTGRRPI
jgi:SAM-dependent methyltransferase